MKKFFLLLLTVSLSLVSMAQSTQLVKVEEILDATTEPQSGTPYVIQCNGQASQVTYMYDNTDTPKANLNGEDPTSLSDAGLYIWYFEPVEGMENTYTLKNYRTGSYVYIQGTSNGGAVTMNASEQMVVISTDDAGEYVALKNPDAEQWIDMGYYGQGISTWGGGVSGSRRMQIYEVSLNEDVDPREVKINDLTTKYSNYSDDIETYEANVGESYGQYREEDVNAFSEAMSTAEDILGQWDEGSYEGTAEDIEAATNNIETTHAAVTANCIPYNYTELSDGYYVVKNCLDFTETVTTKEAVYYTQEEADAANAESGAVEGDENYVTTSTVKEEAETATMHVAKAMYDNNGTASWKSYGNGGVQFLWKLTRDGKNYKMVNMLANRTFSSIATSSAVPLAVVDTLVALDWAQDPVEVQTEGDDETSTTIEVQPIDIRLSGAASRGYLYAHAGGHAAGAGKSGNIVGWSTSAAGEIGATMWYFEQIDDATAEEWMATDYTKAIKYIAYCDSVKNVVPAQITIAEDKTTSVDLTQPVITEGTQFYSPYATLDKGGNNDGYTQEQIYANLISDDETTVTYFHSAWESGSVAQDVHYLQVNDVDLDGTYAVRISRRPVSGDQITKLRVKGYDEDNDELTFADGRDLGTLLLPMGSSNSETLNSTTLFTATSSDKYIRFYSEEEVAFSSGGGSNRGYWHCRKFQIYPATVSTIANPAQAEVRSTQITNLQAAMDEYTAGNFNADSIAAGKQSITDLKAAYDKMVAAENAWVAVYVDPAELRTAIASATTTANGIVIGENPGEWKTGSKAASFKTTVAEAQAYNLAGAYTPETVASYIEKLNEGVTGAIAEANGITTSKWYRIHFATEALYEAQEWDKTGAKAKETSTGTGTDPVVTAPALFGRYVAAAKHDYHYQSYDYEDADTSYTDTVAVYDTKVVAASKINVGDNVKFASLADVKGTGLDEWRFVTFSDSTYALQNKATGLWMHISGSTGQVTVNTNPSFFKAPKAIGAGAMLIPAYDVAGTACNYLHGECATSKLVTWGASTLGCNSMMFIEAAEDFTSEPAVTANYQMWPGNYETHVFETEMTFPETVKVYTKAKVEAGEEENTVTLQLATGNKVPAGQPCVLVAPTDEYISWDEAYTADSLAYVNEYGDPELGFDYDYFAQKAVSDMVAARYATYAITHGTAIKTEVLATGKDLVGTFSYKSGLARGTIQPEDNGFKCAMSGATCGAFGAYIDGTTVITTIAQSQKPVVVKEGVVGLYGDVNADGSVDIADVQAVLDTMNGGTTYEKAADVNADGSVDIADVQAVLTAMNS